MNFCDQQLALTPLLGRMDGPSVVPDSLIKMCKTYRDAVRLCWALRRVRKMTLLTLAEESGWPQGHRSDYLHEQEDRREMPAKHIRAFEATCGNTAVTQWLAMDARLTVLEQITATQRAAA